jgi:hypothetical protein
LGDDAPSQGLAARGDIARVDAARKKKRETTGARAGRPEPLARLRALRKY